MQNLIVRLGADMSSFRKELGKARGEMQNFTSFMGNQMSKISALVAGTAITLGVGDAIRDAVKVEGAIEQVNRLMGSSAQEFLNWAETTSTAFGISKSEALDYGRTYANLTSIFTTSTKETMQTTQDLMKASAVIASKTGRSMEDVMFRMRSGFLGNTEAVEDLGITVYINMIEASDAMKRFANGKHWNDLDFRMQSQIRYYAMLEQAQKKFGNQITDNTGFRIMQFTASLKDLRLALGQAFLPLVFTVLPILTTFVNKLTVAMTFVSSFTKALFGVSAAQTSVKTIGSVTDSIKKNTDVMSDSKKKMKGYLAGFDEINNMPPPETASAPAPDGSGGGGGLGDPQNSEAIGTAMENVNQKAVDMATKVRESFQSITDFIVSHKDIIVPALLGIAAAITTIKTAMMLTSAAGSIFATLTNPIFLIGAAIAGLVAGFLYFYNTNEEFRGTVDSIFESIKTVMSDLWNNVLVPLGTYLSENFAPAWDGVSSVMSALWNNILVPLGQFIGTIFVGAWDALVSVVTWVWKEVFVPFGDFLALMEKALSPLTVAIKEALAMAFDFLGGVVKILWKDIMSPFFSAIGELFAPAVDALSAVLNVLWKVISGIGTIFKWVIAIVAGFFALIGRVIWEVLKPLIKYLQDVFLVVFEEVGESIKGIINGMKKTIKGVLDFITGVFTGDWKKAWEGLKDVVVGIFDALVSVIKTPINLIIGFVNDLIEGINKLSFDIPSWVPLIGGQKFNINIPKIPKLAQGGIVTSPTIAQVGEAGKEMIVPLENTAFVDKLAGALGTAVMTAMQMSNSNNRVDNREVVIKIDGNSIAKALNPYTTKEAGRVGTSILSIS